MKLKLLVLLLSLALFSCQLPTHENPKVNHVALQVSDMEKSVAFYTTVFELKQTNEIKKIAFSNAKGEFTEYNGHIVFLKFPDQDFVYELIASNGEVNEMQSPRCTHVGFEVDDIEIPFQKAVELGADIVVPIRTVKAADIEAKQAFFLGPDGESVELMQMSSCDF